MTTVRDLGELGLLERLRPFCSREIVGDDAAVLALPPGQRLVVTTDVLVDGVHFSDRTTAPFDVGWRATAANLSDLAAMGAAPLGLTVGLSLPGQTPVDWVEGLYQGMAACLQRFGGEIYGGDLCRSDTVTVAITALGAVLPERVLYRHRAQPGQAIVATGYHGLSRAGLEVLLQPEAWTGVPAAVQAEWMQAHRRPIPRFDVLPLLQRGLEAGLAQDQPIAAMDSSDGRRPIPRFDVLPLLQRGLEAGLAQDQPIAAMDSSDGLANAVVQLCRASGVGARLERSQLPLHSNLVRWVGAERAVDWALYGGEDFELVLCLAPNLAQTIVEQLGKGAAVVGEVTTELAVQLQVEQHGAAILLNTGQEFQHFG
ncbi:thiamine-phosphate kinase [Pseudanabaena sp. FACHB-2040]|uniref:thiamine-phosphate kinase n=1 Tax=Pseudanabaena sp. FACHB-2040 TaxID=2692859 RepID=UPI0016872077|nr:thiamine-phosphate kinase [Pseudanabaena sp. FACHB-2040]MBD2257472.1 thiamine-phosphate kinase [Pseudanabaena sp. FACHB-2040]